MGSVEILDFNDALIFNVGCSDRYKCIMHTVLIVLVAYDIIENIIEWKIKNDLVNKTRHSRLKFGYKFGSFIYQCHKY